MKRVTCRSGIQGWQANLRSQYSSFAEFESYSDTYGLATRLGYGSAQKAWEANPVIQGSTNPADYRKVA